VSRNFESTSYGQFAEGYFLTRKTMQHFWQMYVGDGVAPPYADLLAVEDLTGLPPATVITCGLDPLSSEGQIYSQRLAEAGVEVTALHAHGLLHGIWFMDATGRRAYQFGLDIAGALRRAAADATISTRFSPSI
ncbi:MAG: alpha/beta hydrolase fold domain-containing protein, partial [Ilumatobacteraceae bacterium]